MSETAENRAVTEAVQEEKTKQELTILTTTTFLLTTLFSIVTTIT
jgi:hypothetical protein